VRVGVVRKLVVVGAVTAAVFAFAAASASADTWSGQCTFAGRGTFNPPTSYVVTQRNFLVNGTGTCKGTLDGSAYNGPASIFLDGRMQAPMSCEVGVTPTDHVPATLSFGDPNSVDVKQVNVLMPNIHFFFLDAFVVQGAYNGEGLAHWVLGVTAHTLVDCMPPGIPSLPFTMNLQTITKLYG
jgi:hypothetical protein